MADGAHRRIRCWSTWLPQIAKFTGVGICAAAVDYACLHLGMWAGLGPGPARVPAIAIALTFTWILNRTFTFQTNRQPSLREFGQYVLAAAGGAAINFCTYMLLLWAGAPIWLAFALGIGISAVYTFLRYRKLLHHG